MPLTRTLSLALVPCAWSLAFTPFCSCAVLLLLRLQGVRMSEENAKRMRVLEALGLLKLQSNAVHLTDAGAR